MVKGIGNKATQSMESGLLSNTRGYKEVPKPTTGTLPPPQQAGFPNPLAIADAIVPRINPFSFIEDGGDLMSMSPLNLVPGYGKTLANKKQAFRKFGNSIQDVIDRQALSPKGGSPLRLGKSQIVSEGNWAAPDRPWEKYPGVFEATFDFSNPERNIAMQGIRDRSGVLITDREGNLLPEIPLTEPGMSFNRRLPFSTRYVPIDKQKLMDNKFQLATFAPHLQSLAEKYAIGLGGAATLGAMGYPNAVETYNKYTIDPIKNWTKEQWEDYQKSDVYKKFRELDKSVGLDFLYDKKKKGGIIKNDRGQLPKAQLGKVHKKYLPEKVENWQEPKYVAGLNSEGHYGYDGKGTIYYDPNSQIENINNPWWVEHEKYHHFQTLSGRNPKERRQQEVDNQVNEMIKSNPGLQFIPKSKLISGSKPNERGQKFFVGAEDLIYENPSTLEGEARLYEDYINSGGKSIFPQQRNGGMIYYQHGLDWKPKNISRNGFDIPKAQKGKNFPYNPKSNPTGYFSLKNNQDWFDSHANWTNVYKKDKWGNNIRDTNWEDYVRKQILTGRFGLDPQSGALIKLPENEWVNVPQQYKTLASDYRNWTDAEKVANPGSTMVRQSPQEVQRLAKKSPAFKKYADTKKAEIQKLDDIQLRRDLTKSTYDLITNPVMMAPGVILTGSALAGVPAIAETAAAVAPALETTIAGVPGLTAGNLLNAGFAYQGAKNIPNVYNAWKDVANKPTLSGVGNAAAETAVTGLDMLPFGISTAKGIPSVMQDVKQFGNLFNKPKTAPFKNAFQNLQFQGYPSDRYKEVPKPTSVGSSSIKPTINTARNLEDLNTAQKFAQQYGYQLPQNLERIAQSDELTNRTIRGMMDRHNTFVRGVSTNWEELGKRNPEILRHLEGKGFDLSTKEGTKAAAEYMATHIPISTGYGRASLDKNVFDQGLEGLYTSNSIPTAEGYTYGQGYITKVKKPTDFSSTNRQDWIVQNNPDYYEHYLPKNLSIEDVKSRFSVSSSDPKTFYNEGRIGKINVPKVHSWIDDVNNEALRLRKKYNLPEKDKGIYNIEHIIGRKLEQKDFNLPEINKIIKQHKENVLKYIKELGDYDEIRKEKLLQELEPVNEGTFTKNLLKTEHSPRVDESIFRIGDNNTTIKTIYDEIIPKLKLSPKADIELKSDLVKFTEGYRKQGLNLEQIKEKLKLYLKEQYYNDPYAHYIHLGIPGEKVLEPVKSWEITPEIWKNKSRAHSNKYTKKLSALEEGGVIKDDRGQWAHPGKPTRISSPNITMRGVTYPVLAQTNNGQSKIMYPGQDYYFPGADYVDEYPMMQSGGTLLKYQTAGEVDSDKLEKEGFALAQKQLKDWYEQRATLPQFNTIANARLKQLETLPNIKRVPANILNRQGAAAMYKNKKIIVPGKSDFKLNEGDSVFTIYEKDPKTKKVTKRESQAGLSPYVLSHELTHWLDDENPQVVNNNEEQSYPNIKFADSKDVNMPPGFYPWITDTWKKEKQVIHPEFNSMLTNFRSMENLDPTKIYSAQDLLPLIEKYKNLNYEDLDKEKDVYKKNIKVFLESIGNDPEKLAEYQNSIVKNKSNSKIAYAKRGGELPKYQTLGEVTGRNCRGKCWKPTLSDSNNKSNGDIQFVDGAPVTPKELIASGYDIANKKVIKQYANDLQSQFPGLTPDHLAMAMADSARVKAKLWNYDQLNKNIEEYNKRKQTSINDAHSIFPYSDYFYKHYVPSITKDASGKPVPLTASDILSMYSSPQAYEQTVKNNYIVPQRQRGGDISIPQLPNDKILLQYYYNNI